MALLVEGVDMNAALYALIASLALNGFMGWAWIHQRDKLTAARTTITTIEGERDGARADASACSDAVDDLRAVADRNKVDAARARTAAAKKAKGHFDRADEILAKPPAVPGDACASAQALTDEWLKGRAKP